MNFFPTPSMALLILDTEYSGGSTSFIHPYWLSILFCSVKKGKSQTALCASGVKT